MENKELILFSNEEFGDVRFVEINGSLYAIGNDIATVLGYSSPKDAITRHCKGATTYRYLTSGGIQDIKVIPEGDIFRLVVKAADQSKNLNMREKAKKFEIWLFEEVLPSIRKHGAYITDDTLDKMINSPEFGIKLLTELKEEKTRRIEAENKLEEQKPKVELYDAVMNDNGLMNFIQVADVFGECGRNTLMKTLREEKILMGSEFNKNVPYSQYLKNGYFEVVVRPRKTKNGVQEISTTLCKPKALKLIKKVLDKKKDLLEQVN